MNFDTVSKMKKTPQQVERAYDKITLRNNIYIASFYLVIHKYCSGAKIKYA